MILPRDEPVEVQAAHSLENVSVSVESGACVFISC